jgi:hypothetical protein
MLYNAQPTPLQSNFHCVTNPDEPVMDYLSASAVEKKRIFVGVHEMYEMNYEPYYLPCHDLNDVTTVFSPK